ncbi:MAG: bile acid:sodium symporter [Deltaproteobacteria bacterium]|nr:MAG: bile acid:sodium symporter [Deltaproteobacteria bacterium]
MFRIQDLILLLVIFVSILTGVLLPRIGSLFQPFVLYLMMLLLFLSFLTIKTDTIYLTLKKAAGTIALLAVVKTIVLPIGVYFLFKVLCPSYALAALLLSGISTGVVAPFIANVVEANSPLVLVVVVITSLLAPFTLPAIIKILLARSVDISLFAMIRMLCLVVLIPIFAVETLRRFKPALIDGLMRRQFPISLVIFFIINMGVFSQYADFFCQEPATILTALAIAVILSGIYLLAGILSLPLASLENQLAGVISLGNMNSVLIIVFASQFFGPLEATLAAMYHFPFFGLILPLKLYRSWRLDRKQRGAQGVN